MYQQPLLAVGKQALQRQEGEAEGKGNVTVYGTEKKLRRPAICRQRKQGDGISNAHSEQGNASSLAKTLP